MDVSERNITPYLLRVLTYRKKVIFNVLAVAHDNPFPEEGLKQHLQHVLIFLIYLKGKDSNFISDGQ